MTTLDKALAEYARGEHRSIDLILNEIKTAKNFPPAHQCFFPECLRLVDELPDDLILWFTLEPGLVDQCISLLTCISLRNSSVLNQLLIPCDTSSGGSAFGNSQNVISQLEASHRWALQHRFLKETSISALLDLVFMQLIDLEAHVDLTDYSIQNSVLATHDDLLETSSFEKNVLQVLEVLCLSDCNERSKLMFDARPDSQVPAKMNKKDWSQLCSIFRCMRTRFFHLRPGVAVSYAESLWNFVRDVRQPTESRVRCVAYLSDTLARSNYESPEVLLELLHDMTSWHHRRLDWLPSKLFEEISGLHNAPGQ
nr:unnamed protein product [Spirometra erinaceieuropaei]